MIPNISHWEYDNEGSEHRRDLRRFPNGFWENKEKAWGGSDFRSMLGQVFLAIGDDDEVLPRTKWQVRRALKLIRDVTLRVREHGSMSEDELEVLMKQLCTMSEMIKKAFSSHRPSKYKHPKFHSKVHYRHWLRLYGSFGNFNTESYEAWFKAGVKDASQLGNQKTDGFEQISMRHKMRETCCAEETFNTTQLKKSRTKRFSDQINCLSRCKCESCLSGDCASCNAGENEGRACHDIYDEGFKKFLLFRIILQDFR